MATAKINPNQNPAFGEVTGVGGAGAPRMTVVSTSGPVFAASYGQLIAADPTGGNIAVNLPAANAVTPTGSNVISVTNNSDSANAVTITPAGGDTINGAATLVLAARESITLTSDGVSEWFVF
jgi:hypothetical protein